MDATKLWARHGDAVRQAIELGELVHLDTASEALMDAFLLFAIESSLLQRWATSFPDPRPEPETGMEVISPTHSAGRFAGLYVLAQREVERSASRLEHRERSENATPSCAIILPRWRACALPAMLLRVPQPVPSSSFNLGLASGRGAGSRPTRRPTPLPAPTPETPRLRGWLPPPALVRAPSASPEAQRGGALWRHPPPYTSS